METPKKPFGRPKLAETREIVLQTRITAEEKARFEEKAQSLGLSLSAWVRKALQKAAK